MKQPHYTFAIFFLALSIVCGVLQSSFNIRVGEGILYLQNFAHWYLAMSLILIIATLFVLHYLRLRFYKPAFYAGVLFTAFLVFQATFNYIFLIYVLREFRGYVLLLSISQLVAGMAFAATLIFTRASERPWLKAAGIIMLIFYTILASAIIAALLSPLFISNGTFGKIEQWVGLAGNLVPFLFIMNFLSELRSGGIVTPAVDRRSSLVSVFAALTMIVTIVALTLGSQVARESYWHTDWQKRAPEKNKELAKDFETRIYVKGRGDTLYYLFRKPLGYDPQKKYPLVVCLHGGPVRERKIEVAEPAPLLSEPGNLEKYPAFLLVPQAPPGYAWGGVPGLPSVDLLVFDVMAALEEEFSIDQTRRYVVGGSMGGYGAWHFVGSRPGMFAAAMPFCGAGDPELAENMIETAVWAFHGDADRNVPVRGSREMIEAIRKAGGTPLYTEFSGTGHNVWPDISKTPGVLDWLFAQRRGVEDSVR